MTLHDRKAAEFRGLAEGARDRAASTLLPMVRETEQRAAASWEALALLEDFFLRGGSVRPGVLRDPDVEPL